MDILIWFDLIWCELSVSNKLKLRENIIKAFLNEPFDASIQEVMMSKQLNYCIIVFYYFLNVYASLQC